MAEYIPAVLRYPVGVQGEQGTDQHVGQAGQDSSPRRSHGGRRAGGRHRAPGPGINLIN